jgi:trk system potassium uptake protein TrkH
MSKIFTPVQTIVTGYIVIIITGAFLLWLPISAMPDKTTSFIDALFTSTSALSTTGLATVDTGSHFSYFGQIVIMILIQIGGLGYMIFIGMAVFGLRAQFSINGRILFAESIARPKTIQIKKFVKAVIIFTLFFELLGAIGLFTVFLERCSCSDAIYSACFHSISAFCTAGFSVYADSFTAYADNIYANMIIAVITIAGGIGFFVLYDLSDYFRKILRKQNPIVLSDHSKLVLIMSLILMTTGTTALFINADATNMNLSLWNRFLTASFQAISASSTTGFNSVDIGSMSVINLLFVIILMFVGASPGSTGGGIKTTTLGIVFLFFRALLTNHDEISVFRRVVDNSTLYKAIGLVLMAGIYLITIVIILVAGEPFSLLQITFEVASALGTVGLSMGITPALSVTGKIIITITMLIGRVGPLALGYSLIGRTESKRYAYPNGSVMIG